VTTDDLSWWTREGSPDEGFRYLKVGGGELTSKSALARIESLVIPPAWTEVHISPDTDRKIQAWGRDDAGRKQYIYSEQAVEEREARKWRKVARFGAALPALRGRVNEDLQRPELDRQKVWGSKSKSNKAAKDLSAFRFITNFVRHKRRHDL